jgi:2,4-dienoyl-CoA reductase (NADPH2)
VLVVGAGPAGLQAAIAAAERGHRATVWERDAEPGGQLRWAASVPSRAELGDLVRNQVRACANLGVTVEYGHEADLGDLVAAGADAVVVATGSRPARPWWAGQGPSGTGGTPVVDVLDVLEGRVRPEGEVLLIDELGFHQATSVAELLADRGCRVEVLTPGMVVGQDLGITLDLETWWYRATAKGILQTTDTVVVGMEEGKLVALHHPTGRTDLRQADWVVLAVPPAPADELYLAAKGVLPDVRRVGDCVAPRRAHAAVVEGQRAGEAL